MDRAAVHEFIREVIGPNTERVDTTGWVSIRCPLAKWRHANGKDSRPSAGISVNDNGNSVFNCYSCHAKGPLAYLLRQLERYTGEDWSEYIETLETDELLGGTLPEWGAKVSAQNALVEVPEEHIDLYEPILEDDYPPYLTKRGISFATAKKLELVIDPSDSEGEERILFPVRGRAGVLYGFTGRATSASARLKVRDYFGLQKRLLLLGAHAIEADAKYVILVEGLFDYARMREFGQPAMAFMSSTLTPAQAEIVKDIGLPVYFFHDNDEPGLDARDKAAEALCRYVPMMKVRYPKRQLRHSRTGETRGLKDPAELREDEILQMIADAKLL
jgi:DNA primase